MPLVLLLLFVVVPIVEIWLIVQVGQAIGVPATILLLLADAVLGTWLFRREGRKAWAALRDAIQAGRVPTKEVADGALVVVGGAFLLAPGFLTDAIGLLCVLPPTRAVLRRMLYGLVGRRLLVVPTRGPWRGRRPAGPAQRGADPRTDGGVIDGEVLDE